MQIDPASDTLVSMFARRVSASGDKTALAFRDKDAWQEWTWNELHHRVFSAAARLQSLGVQPDDRVALVAPNSPQWIVYDLAIMICRAVHVPLHATLTAPQIAEQLRLCQPRLVLFFGNEIKEKVPADTYDVHEATFDAANDVAPDDAKAIQRAALENVAPDDLATILYTSGTTGEPKGVMLTQRNLVCNAAGSLEAFDVREEDLRISLLPWSHIFARTCDLYTWIGSGPRLAIAESRETVLANCAELQPTLINAVPYFYDKVFQALTAAGAADTPGALQKMLGGRMRLCVSGGAALPEHVERFFQEQGVTLLQGYGLTETSPVISTCTPERVKIGTVGPPIRDVEVRIAEDGEILTRGPHVMEGYYHNPEATAAAIRDGWFYTGDLGTLDEDGFLTITGRKKEIIVLATGKNIAPAMIEGLLCQDPLIEQALVYGSEQNYLVALIVPNPDALREAIKRQKIRVFSRAGALSNKRVLEMYQSRIDERLTGLSASEQVRKFKLLDRGFTIESGELTPTLKLRRDAIVANFANVLRTLYEQTSD